jgi:xylan 1,4-beta-xylosidase
MREEHFLINFRANGRTLRHTWSNCVGAGRANEGLRADWQQQLKVVTQECGFRYLRFHGLLHDDMHVYTEEGGEPHYNFQYIDKLFDYMLDCNIRPIVEFGFMPEVLASNDSTQFWWKGHVAPPNNYEKWALLVAELVRHWMSRYGKEEIETWYYEIWNEPNLKPFWNGTKAQYFELYKVSVLAIKSLDEKLRVGGPATSNFVPDERFDGEMEDLSKHATFQVEDIDSLQWRGVWIKDFLSYCENENLPVDFVSTHPYPTDFALDGHGECSGKSRYRDSLYDDILWLKDVIADSAYPDAEIHLTEWSTSPTSRDYSHDYLPAATYVMHSNLKVANLVDSLSYWVFTDVFEEVGAGPKAFHGGFGMLTLQGVKKPVFHAYRMMNNLGEEELKRGEGYIFTRKGDQLSAVFYNYPENFKGTVPMSIYPDQTVARECQAFGEKRELSFIVIGLNQGDNYTLRVLRKQDSAIELWNKMGAPTAPNRSQEKQLRQQGETLEENLFTVNENGELHLNVSLDSWEIAELCLQV